MEQWKPIDGTDGKYEVSNLGRVRTNGKRPGLLTLTKQPKGYLYAMIQLSNGKQKNCRVHWLVAEHFLLNPDNLKEVNHKDGNKENNRSDNLEWCTRSHNVQHSYDTGLKQPHRLTDEERQHLRDVNKGKTLSPEHCAKISATLKGRKHPGQSERLKGKAPLKAIEASIAARKRKAEERRAIEAAKPRRPRGRPRKHPTDRPRGG